MITRDDFIRYYMARSRIDIKCKTKDGFKSGNLIRHAVECFCGEEGCEGWKMISDEEYKECRR